MDDIRGEIWALKFICTALLAQTAMHADNPHERLQELVSGISGWADQLAQVAQQNGDGRDSPMTVQVTATIEQIARWAEGKIPKK